MPSVMWSIHFDSVPQIFFFFGRMLHSFLMIPITDFPYRIFFKQSQFYLTLTIPNFISYSLSNADKRFEINVIYCFPASISDNIL